MVADLVRADDWLIVLHLDYSGQVLTMLLLLLAGLALRIAVIAEVVALRVLLGLPLSDDQHLREVSAKDIAIIMDDVNLLELL